ncbi:hypothetical protein Glove_26g249 [Diversispora epigaea]|uniref:Uncharacterized protein n=1 Tax=Diversispora epigaea TaxID=1348612 RepID=A0A397JMP8_9GLOM|nr:hypothetical protein Glove_26g249 [Diversispora epigaea]
MRLLLSTNYPHIMKLLKNGKKDKVNIELWQEHSLRLGKLAVENRINKCEIFDYWNTRSNRSGGNDV